MLGRTAALAWHALPLALLLFLLFPRLPGPFWGIAAGQSARTGLDDEIMPGDVSDLSVSGDGRVPRPLRRARSRRRRSVTGAARCCTSSTAAAGAVRWRRHSRSRSVTWIGAPVDYQITLEPHDRPWMLALDLPAAWPEREASQHLRLSARRAGN